MQPKVLARGLNASPGQATGVIVFQADEAVRRAATGESVILVRNEASAEDLGGLKAAAGIFCVRGGLTADAAIVARSLGKPCVAGCPSVTLNHTAETLTFTLGDSHPVERIILKRGDALTIDGSSGLVYQAAAQP
jgi:pyruvate,orthophosphate dikinase